MVKFRKTGRFSAIFMALSVLAGSVNLPEGGIGTDNAVSAASLETGDRILVDLNRNDGRTVAHSLNGENWILDDGESSRSTTIEGLSMTISASGGELKIVDNKKLHFYNEQYSRLMCDGMTVDADSGGTLKLTISGLSDGTHSIKTYHAATGNETTSTLSVTINGKTSTGVMCPNQVTKDDDAGLAYATFTGTSVTVEIKPEGSGNAWLNAFEIDGGDPINGVNHTYPIDQEKHLEREKGLSWTAGKNAKSHNVYIGTSYDDVFSATTSSKEFKGNQTGTTYALNDSYTSVEPYYWRVDTVDSSGNVIKGSVYSFYVARLAFPTAEGYGRYARGGQGGVVVHVTNLNDSGEGSLRWALCDEKWQEDEYEGVPRIIVFDVGGVIKLESRLTIPNNGGSVYVAGQTAPGDGITVTQYDFGALGSDDVIIRDVRTRIGDYAGKSMGGMGLGSCDNSIIDHCSISWATDEGFSSRQSKDITFQWNIIGESLHDSVHYNGDDRTQTETHAFAASIGGDVGSFHHNLLIDCTGRNWSLAGGLEQNAVEYAGYLDIKNNVVYNWRDRTTDGGINSVNFVNNYYKAGAESDTDLHFIDISDEICDGIQRAYVSGNKMVTSSGGTIVSASDDAWALDRARISSGNQTQAEGKMDSEMWEDYIELESADNAYKSVIAAAGAGGTSETGWDYIDSRYIKEVTNGTYTYKGSKQGLKGIIDSQNDAGGYPTSSNFAHSTDGMCNAKNDTDRDGMPNTWEEQHGLDPNDGTDGSICTLSADGYTNVEMFLNELMGDPVVYNGTGEIEPEEVKGDVDADGDADAADVKALQDYLLCRVDTLPDWQAGDLIEDDKLDGFDLAALKRLVGGGQATTEPTTEPTDAVPELTNCKLIVPVEGTATIDVGTIQEVETITLQMDTTRDYILHLNVGFWSAWCNIQCENGVLTQVDTEQSIENLSISGSTVTITLTDGVYASVDESKSSQLPYEGKITLHHNSGNYDIGVKDYNVGLGEEKSVSVVDTTQLYGWAACSGDGLDTTTGGAGGETVTVSSLAEIAKVCADDTPRTIIIDGTITCENTGITLGSNKTVVGKDKNAAIKGAIYMNGESNIIISNLTFHGFYPDSGPDDCISARDVHHLWLDHLTLHDAGDGLMDITIGSNYVTVSWCKFYYTDLSNDHRLCSLVGSGADHDDTDMGRNKATYHHNWFAEGVDQRMPRILYGQGHVYNNYYTCEGNYYCIGAGCYASVLVEGNYFKNVNNPHQMAYTHARPVYITARDNVYDNTTGSKDTGLGGSAYGNVEAFTDPPYDYVLTPAEDVPALVERYAGPQ